MDGVNMWREAQEAHWRAAANTRYVYTDAEGVERVLTADSLAQARNAIRRVERNRSESLAAAEIAAQTAVALVPVQHEMVDGPLGHLEAS